MPCRWRLLKLNYPLVATLPFVVHKYGSGCVFVHHSARLAASLVQSLLGIVDDEFLAKGIDKTLRAAADNELIRVGRRKLHCVTYLVAPQAARRTDNNGIVLVLLDRPKGQHCGVLLAYLIEWYKFKEHAIVDHQEHREVEWVVL